jgi:adenylylsulfate kinase-like enzyme
MKKESDLAIIADAVLSPVRKRFPRLPRIVINIRGTNGCGKTTLAKSLLESYPNKPIFKDKEKKLINGYVIKTPNVRTYLVGPYRITTGGCDAIGPIAQAAGVKPFDYICDLVREFSEKGNVVFEGAIVATVTGRWVELARSLPETSFIFGFMDTSLERCLKRVAKRRLKRGDTRPLDPNVSVIPKYEAVMGSKIRLKEEGMDVRTIPHKNALPTILEWLKGE